MHIKASHITNLTDARYFAAKEVHFLGFQLEAGAEDFLDPIYMKAIREWVEGPLIVGEYSVSPAETIAEAAAFFGLDAVEVGEAQLPHLDALRRLRVLLRLEQSVEPASARQALEQAKGRFEFAVLQLNDPMVLAADPGAWKALFSDFPILLHGNFSPTQYLQIMEQFAPAGFSLRGGAEEKVGVKSFDEIDAIFDALEK
jgi:phosphoribosylanthranilate isomerase